MMTNGSDWLPPGASKPQVEETTKKKAEFLGYGVGHWVAAGILAVAALLWLAVRDDNSPHSATGTADLDKPVAIAPQGNVGSASRAENQTYALCSAALAYESQSSSDELKDSYIHLSRVYLNKMDAQHRPAVEAIMAKMFSGEIPKGQIDGTVVNCVNALK